MKKILSFLFIAGSYMGYSQCTPVMAPWVDDVESYSPTTGTIAAGCWTEVSPDSPDWNIDGAGSTGSSNTGPDMGAHSGSNYFYLETSSGSTGQTAELITPEIDLSSLTYPALSFWYHMFGATMQDLDVEVLSGGNWIPMYTIPGNSQQASGSDPWLQQVISLTAFTGVVKVKFIGAKGSSFTGDACLDDIGIIDCTPTYSTISAYSCQFYTAPSGKLLHDAGTYFDTIANSVGCDSIITINLTSDNTSSTMVLTNICGTYILPVTGEVVGDDGIYATDTLPNSVGCDSVVYYDLDFDNSYYSFDASSCNVYTAPSGAQHTTSGLKMDTITNAAGCDSIMTINLTMYYNNSVTLFVSSCGGSYTSNAGNVYTATGVYIENFASVNGCDSILYIDFTVSESVDQNIAVDACDEWTAPDGTVMTANGTHVETFTSSTGCDSVNTYQVTINTVNAAITLINALTLEANETGATYQWLDCNNGSAPIAGETGQTYIASVNGDYACEVTKNNCTEVSPCVRIGSLGLENETTPFSIYPNPSNGTFNVVLNEVLENTLVNITNVAGQVIYSSSINQTNNTIELTNIETGIYYIQVSNNNGSTVKSIIVE
ncbi:T9SS type A sorting domain-containing protein [Putridiphycobacter roseus]|nr:T9SS type A sorting domain-containing protein [Putridiphycobacter roseus]